MLFSFVAIVMLVGWINRTSLEVNVLADRNPPYVLLTDGGIRNAYTVKVLNKLHQPRTFAIEARGLPGANVAVIGSSSTDPAEVHVPTDTVRDFRVLVVVPHSQLGRLSDVSHPFELVAVDRTSRREAQRQTSFRSPPSGRRNAP